MGKDVEACGACILAGRIRPACALRLRACALTERDRLSQGWLRKPLIQRSKPDGAASYPRSSSLSGVAGTPKESQIWWISAKAGSHLSGEPITRLPAARTARRLGFDTRTDAVAAARFAFAVSIAAFLMATMCYGSAKIITAEVPLPPKNPEMTPDVVATYCLPSSS